MHPAHLAISSVLKAIKHSHSHGKARYRMKITRRFTTAGQNPYDSVSWTKRSSRISNPDGSVVFAMEDAEVPSSWSQLATDIMVSKYFRKAGVPQFDDGGQMVRDEDGEAVTGPERSARQVALILVQLALE